MAKQNWQLCRCCSRQAGQAYNLGKVDRSAESRNRRDLKAQNCGGVATQAYVGCHRQRAAEGEGVGCCAQQICNECVDRNCIFDCILIRESQPPATRSACYGKQIAWEQLDSARVGSSRLESPHSFVN